MISSLSGTLLDTATSPLTIQVAGIGYEVFVTSDTLAGSIEGSSCTLWIHHVTREDSEELFGFKHKTERDFFRKLISVSGIGPRGALAILEASTIDTLASVIENKQTDVLSKLPGIGKKTAEKIVLELHGKLGDFGTSGKCLRVGEDFKSNSPHIEG